MGGVDRANNLRAQLTTIRRCRKWWHSIWYWILDTSLVNAHILFRETTSISMQRSDFLHEIISSLFSAGGVPQTYEKTLTPHYYSRHTRGHCVHCYEVHKVRKFTFDYCRWCKKHCHPRCFEVYHEAADRDF
jgi:hypothetical protein